MRIGRSLEVFKSVEDTRVLSTFLAARAEHPQTWAVWHSRIATQGQLVRENCHPFLVPGRPWAMAHNGILPLSDPPTIRRGGIERSDSRILAEDHLSLAHWRHIRSGQDEWEEWLGSSKVVLLSSEKERGGPILILNERLGTWQDGCWHSHGKYTYVSTSASAHTPIDDDDDEWDYWADYQERRGTDWCDVCGHATCLCCQRCGATNTGHDMCVCNPNTYMLTLPAISPTKR